MDERSDPTSSTHQNGLGSSTTRPTARTPSPSLPDIPAADLDLTLSFDSIMGSSSAEKEPHAERVQKRASNVLKLTQEHEKLKEELRAMTARLEAAERRRQDIVNRQPSSVVTESHPARAQGC